MKSSGFLGAFAYIAFNATMTVRMIWLARVARKDYGALICAGVAALMMAQTLENIGMCLAMVPVVGITLPFCSYGGSSILSLYICLGLIMSISTHNKNIILKEKARKRFLFWQRLLLCQKKNFSICIHTLGCRANQYESDAIAAALCAEGFRIVTANERADVSIINTCTVTAESDRKSRQLIRRCRAVSDHVIVTGCFAEISPDAAKSIDGVDAVIGNKNKSSVIDAVKRFAEGSAYRRDDFSEDFESFEECGALSGGCAVRARAYVKIEDGCDNRCAYCIIPKARGSGEIKVSGGRYFGSRSACVIRCMRSDPHGNRNGFVRQGLRKRVRYLRAFARYLAYRRNKADRNGFSRSIVNARRFSEKAFDSSEGAPAFSHIASKRIVRNPRRDETAL